MKKTPLFRGFFGLIGRHTLSGIFGNQLGVLLGKGFFRKDFRFFHRSFLVLFNLSILFSFTQVLAAHTMTANGNAQIDTAQSKFGGASGLFDGTGDTVSTPDNADWALGSGDFTMGIWVRINAYQDFQYSSQSNYPTDISFAAAIINSGAGFNFYYSTDGTTLLTCATAPASAIPLTTWTHLEADRSGNNLRLFIDGTQSGATCDFTGVTLFDAPQPLIISAANLNGWFDEMIFIKGLASHTANFTSPTSAYACGQPATTVLLLHMDGTDASTVFTDDSTTACGGGGATTVDAGEGFLYDTIP